MAKHLGNGGLLVKDGIAIAQVMDYTWSESLGRHVGQTQSDVSMVISLEGQPLRVNDTFDLKLKLYGADTNYLTIGDVVVETVSTTIMVDDVVKQSVSVVGFTTPTYAAIP